MKIILNGQEIEVNPKLKQLTYEEITAMAYQPTVTFAKGHKSKPQGMLHRGGTVKVVEGMVITCLRTGNA